MTDVEKECKCQKAFARRRIDFDKSCLYCLSCFLDFLKENNEVPEKKINITEDLCLDEFFELIFNESAESETDNVSLAESEENTALIEIKNNIIKSEKYHSEAKKQRNQQIYNYQAKMLESSLSKLRKTHLLNSCFYVWVIEEFGVLNGYRIGRTTSCWVCDEEINYGLGDLAILFAYFVRKLNIDSGYRFYLLGQNSYITYNDHSKDKFPLYITSNIFFNVFYLPKFNFALQSLAKIYLLIIKEIKTEKNLTEPFTVDENGMINNFSIEYSVGQESRWTNAMKFFLINVKWLIGVVSMVVLDVDN